MKYIDYIYEPVASESNDGNIRSSMVMMRRGSGTAAGVGGLSGQPALTALTALLVFVTRQGLAGNDEFFDEDFNKDFNNLESGNKFYNKIEDGFRNWEERCLAIGGEGVLRAWQKEQENLIHCFMQEFDFDEIQAEIQEKKKTGELDEVFKNYCGNHVVRGRKCLEKFLEISHRCLHAEDRSGLNVTLEMVDAAINFTCHNSGDRIALFMAEEGMECVDAHKEEMLACINSSVPEVFQAGDKSSSGMHFYVFQQENCRKGDAIMQCVEQSLMQCPDPTPSNLVHGLLRSMREQTPCAGMAQSWRSSSSLSPLLALLLLTSCQALLLHV